MGGRKMFKFFKRDKEKENGKKVLKSAQTDSPLKGVLDKTLCQNIRIQTSAQGTSIMDSKFGGLPYFPESEKYPTDGDGRPMILLAQLNLEEVRRFTGNTLLPQTGMLQFYVAANNEIGIDQHHLDSQKDSRALYFEAINGDGSDLLSNFDFVEGHSEFPIKQEQKLLFRDNQEYINPTDELTFQKHFNMDPFDFFNQPHLFKDEDASEASYDGYCRKAEGHKIGGYPHIIHSDPRMNQPRYENYDTLLLQVDTDRKAGIEYGFRGGTGFFLINQEDLKNKNFSKVFYYWSS